MRNKLKLVAILAIAGLLVVSCKKENLVETIENGSESIFTYSSDSPTDNTKDGSDAGAMILGNEREIPYSLSNMRNALSFINANATSALQATIYPTHYYIQFNPTTNEHVTLLDSLCNEYPIYNYPLHYEVLQEELFNSYGY